MTLQSVQEKMSNDIKIVAWNANGIRQHIGELEIFLKLNKVDICLISETHLAKSQNVRISNFICYHSPHPTDTARGGSAILIKNNIQHYLDPNVSNHVMQVTTISIGVKNKQLKVAAIYCPPNCSSVEEDYVNLFKALGANFIIGGDFNAKHSFWGSRLINTRGRKIYKAARKCNCDFFSTGTPTYWPTDPLKIPDLIDFFLTKGVTRNKVRLENSEELSSDHSPIILTLSETPIKCKNNPGLTNNRTNWLNFRRKLEEYINPYSTITTSEDIDKELEQFIADIQQAAIVSTPATNSLVHDTKYPRHVLKLIREKRRARRKWQATRYQGDKIVFNQLNNQLKKLISDIKNESIGRFLTNLTPGKDTDYSLWKAARNLNRPQRQVPPIKDNAGKWVGNPKQKSSIFADHLCNTFKPYPQTTNDEYITLTEKVDEEDISHVSLREIRNVCNHLNTKKTPGYDLITNKIIKELPKKALLKLQYIINACFKTKYVPRHWKIAEVIVIPKPGKPTSDVSSYRPISLLPTLSKVFERLFLTRLNKIIDRRKLIPNHQFGFRENHSTLDQVHRLTDLVERSFEQNKICSAIFLDVAQAFDKVWHQGLEVKLQRDLPRQYYEFLKSYLTERFFRVRYGGEYSDIKEISAGVPQGSVLGPVLYLLYTRDIPRDENTLLGTFADDTAILAVDKTIEGSSSKLQKAVNRIAGWTQKWRIKLNETKSTHVNFTYKNISAKPIFINQKVIPYSNNAKYLGMTLDSKLKWKEHIKKKKEELNLKYRKLYWLIGRNSQLSISNKILLYKQILKPVWTYGIQLWGCTSKSTAKTIQTFQNTVLRGIVNAPWYIRNNDLHRDLQLNLVSDEIKKIANKHNQRLELHTNSEMIGLLVPHNLRRLKRVKPQELV